MVKLIQIICQKRILDINQMTIEDKTDSQTQTINIYSEDDSLITVHREKLSDFFQNSPLAETSIDLERDKNPLREEFVL